MNYSIFREETKSGEIKDMNPPKPKKARTKGQDCMDESADRDVDSSSDADETLAPRTRPSRSRGGSAARALNSQTDTTSQAGASSSTGLFQTDSLMPVPSSQTSNGALSNLMDTSSVADRREVPRPRIVISADKMNLFKEQLDIIRNTAQDSNALSLDEFRTAFDSAIASKGEVSWTEPQVDSALRMMEDENLVMVADEMLFFM